MADEATATLSKRNGEIKVFKEPVVRDLGQDKKNLDVLIGSLIKVQKQVNDALTKIVESEKGIITNSSKTTEDIDNEENEEDDDDDDDDDENKDKDSCEPIPKKPKTL